MIPREILKKIRQIELRTNRLVTKSAAGARASARFTARTPAASKTNPALNSIRALKRRERRAPAALERENELVFGPPSPVSSPPGENFNRSRLQLIRQSIRPIQSQVFPKTQEAFLLLLGEKAGMREVVKQTLSSRAFHFSRRRSSAGFREP
jgi:hypothetical protein